LFGALAALFLAACGTPAPRPVVERPAPVPTETTKPIATKPTTSSAKKGGGYYQDDGPGDEVPPDLDAIPDAQPRHEPLHRFANNSYAVLGRDYVPMRSARSFREKGVASWYGRKFHGQKTSSGDTYDMFGMTAAHPTLPIPSYARVTNPANGRSVIVRVNDRGPFHSGRIIDLSYTAAWKLGYVDRGSTLVEVESIQPGQATDVARTAEPRDPLERFAATERTPETRSETPGIWVQFAAFGNPDNAESFRLHLTRELDWLADRVVLQAAGKVVRVQAGPFRDRSEAEVVVEKVRSVFGGKPAIVLR
jgi:rare lipoprotein A